MAEKDLVEKIAEEFEREALEYIENVVESGSGREEDTEKARETVRSVVVYCTEQAKQNARTPEEFKNEYNACIKEWFSTLMLISNKFLKKSARKARASREEK